MRLPRHPRPPDPAFANAILTHFVVMPGVHIIHPDYWIWTRERNFPYAVVRFYPDSSVILNMATTDWNLDARAVEKVRRLLRSLENRCKHVEIGPRMVEAYGMPLDRARIVAFRLVELALDARPPGKGDTP